MSQSKVELIPLAISDLSIAFARKLDSNKILHYRVSAIQSILGVPGFDAFELVKGHIQEWEPGVEVILKESVLPTDVIAANSGLLLEDMEAKVLDAIPRVRRELRRVRTKNQLYQFNRHESPDDYPQDEPRLKDVKDQPKASDYDLTDRMQYLAYNQAMYRYVPVNMPLVSRLSYYASKLGLPFPGQSQRMRRHVEPVRYLAYNYELPDEAKAIKAMQDDLQILSKRGLIMGSLSMPVSLYLADTVGSGQARKALFCFVIVDTKKLCKQVGKTILELPRNPLSVIGIQGETTEGEVGKNVTDQMYVIESVNIDPAASNTLRQAYIQNYLENQPYEQAAAAARALALSKLVVESDSVQGPGKTVEVFVKVSKKDDT